MKSGSSRLGVYSEVGKLRKVMVCSPGLAHQRLTPSNCDDLLFDDVLWTNQAKRDHFDFVTKMRERDIEVLEMHNLLTETLENRDAMRWILERKVTSNLVGFGLADEVRRSSTSTVGDLLERVLCSLLGVASKIDATIAADRVDLVHELFKCLLALVEVRLTRIALRHGVDPPAACSRPSS